MKNKYTRLLGNTMIFAIGTFSSKVLVFLMMHMIPGDPVKNMMGLEASKEAVEAER